MIATIWTQKNCRVCEMEKELLLREGYELDERDADEIRTGGDRDALTAFSMQNDALPLVRIDGKYMKTRCGMSDEW